MVSGVTNGELMSVLLVVVLQACNTFELCHTARVAKINVVCMLC